MKGLGRTDLRLISPVGNYMICRLKFPEKRQYDPQYLKNRTIQTNRESIADLEAKN
jgi:hypothetical protein